MQRQELCCMGERRAIEEGITHLAMLIYVESHEAGYLSAALKGFNSVCESIICFELNGATSVFGGGGGQSSGKGEPNVVVSMRQTKALSELFGLGWLCIEGRCAGGFPHACN